MTNEPLKEISTTFITHTSISNITSGSILTVSIQPWYKIHISLLNALLSIRQLVNIKSTGSEVSFDKHVLCKNTVVAVGKIK